MPVHGFALQAELGGNISDRDIVRTGQFGECPLVLSFDLMTPLKELYYSVGTRGDFRGQTRLRTTSSIAVFAHEVELRSLRLDGVEFSRLGIWAVVIPGQRRSRWINTVPPLRSIAMCTKARAGCIGHAHVEQSAGGIKEPVDSCAAAIRWHRGRVVRRVSEDKVPGHRLPPFKDLLDTVAVQSELATDLTEAHTFRAHLGDRGLTLLSELAVPLPHQRQASADLASTFGGVGDVLNLVDVGQWVLHSMIVRGLPTDITVVGTWSARYTYDQQKRQPPAVLQHRPGVWIDSVRSQP